MALLEKIASLKRAGIPEERIIESLKEEGNSPREISEALSQLKIKSAVASENQDEMQPSISNQNEEQPSNELNQYSQANQQVPVPTQGYNQQYSQQYSQEQTYPQNQQPEQQQQYYDPNAYQQQGYAPQGLDIETVRDIAKQELEESSKKMKAQLDILTKSKSDMSFQLQSMENRLVKIEEIIQTLQTAIIRKMGEYGEAVSSISNEIQETQKSFSKMVNPILDQRRGIKTNSQEQGEEAQEQQENSKSNQKESRISKKPAGSVEEYFR